MSTSTLSRSAHGALRAGARTQIRSPALRYTIRRQARFGSSYPPEQRSRRAGKIFGLLSIAVLCGAAAWAYPIYFKQQEEDATTGIPQAEIEFEKARPTPTSKEDNRDTISSQHLQVKKSWEHPGVYAWGSNSGKVVAPDEAEAVVKTPRRIPFFDGQILRDLRLDRNFGVAVTEKGDLLQWGTGFSKTSTAPVPTLTGKDIVKAAISRDRIMALSSDGSVYSLPVAQLDQQSGEKPRQSSSWIPFWSNPAPLSYRVLRPAKLRWGEKVVDVSSGLEHCLLLTSQGRVFSAASSTEDFPSKGQLGVPGLTWATRPAGPYDQLHELATLRGFNIVKIATGDNHSLVLDDEGRVFAFGDNSFGQLGFPADPELPSIDVPSLLPFGKLYSGTGLVPRVTGVAAGGSNSYFTVDATKSSAATAASSPAAPSVVADTWACGGGIYGGLGTGKWTHISAGPTKIKALSGLREYDEKTRSVVPIRVARISAGSTHASAVLHNATYLGASGRTSDNDTNYGADVVWWGGNEYYQLGTGRRSNANEPTYIEPLDSRAPERGNRGAAEEAQDRSEHRFQITPRKTVRLGEGGGDGRRVSVEQRVVCGRYVTAVYSAA